MGKPVRGVAVLLLLALVACSDDARVPARSGADPAPMPLARTEVSGTQWRGDRIVVVGGLTKDGKASARADVYRAASNRWTRLPDLPVALHHTAAVEFLARVFVVGGYTIQKAQWVESARVFSLGAGDNAWREEPPLPAPRGAHAAAPLRNHIVVMGGVSQGQVAASTVVYTPGSGWAPGPSFLQPREHLAATVDAQRIYAIGGRAEGGNLTEVESWDGFADAWWREPALNDARSGIGAATIGSRPCVAGGEVPGGKTIGSVECLYGDRWRRVAQLASPRHGLAVVAIVGTLHVIGGGPKAGLFVSRAHEALKPRL